MCRCAREKKNPKKSHFFGLRRHFILLSPCFANKLALIALLISTKGFRQMFKKYYSQLREEDFVILASLKFEMYVMYLLYMFLLVEYISPRILKES